LKKYIFGVRHVQNNQTMETRLESDFLLEIPNTKERKKDAELMIEMANNEIFKTSQKEAIKAYNFEELSHSLAAIPFIIKANNLTAHMIETDFKFDREDLDIWIRSINVTNDKTKLIESMIHI